MIEHPAVVLRRIARRQSLTRRRVEHVVTDLRAVEFFGIDDPQQRRGIADRSDAEEPRLAGLTQRFKRRNHLIQHLIGAERVTAAVHRDRIVQMENVDMIHLQPRQAAIQRLRHCGGNAAEIRCRQADC